MYLHERDNWTAFTWDESAIRPLLGHAHFAQGRLLGAMKNVGFDAMVALESESIASNIVSSSRIEGQQLDLEKVRSSIARRLNLSSEADTLSSHEVDGAVDLMLDATKHAALPLTAERLFGWHAGLFPTGYSGLHRIAVGEYRSTPMEVVSGAFGHERTHYRAPEASALKPLMDEFLAWFNGDAACDWVLQAGIAHLWFLTVHPFEDGNGRIARAIAELALARSDGNARRFYSMSSYILAHRQDYYRELEAAQKGTNDITRWLTWFLQALIGSLELAETELEAVLRQSAYWSSLDSIPLNSRQRKILAKLLSGFEGKLTAQKWAKICKVSPDTALRDINDLIAKGVLSREAAGGRSTSYQLVSFKG